jgi:DNA polymerase-3 subunit delta'
VGRARAFDLPRYTTARGHALTILSTALRTGEHSELFKVTETYRPGADGRAKTDELLRTLYSLLQDLLFLNSGTPELIHNTDILGELQKLSLAADFDWIRSASDRLSEVERGMRRNLLRSLSLDAFEAALEKG